MKKTRYNSRSHTADSFLHRAVPVLLPLFFFLIMCLGHSSTSRPVFLGLAGLMLVLGAVRFRYLRDQIFLPLIALTAFVTLSGISTFYAISGKFALEEFLNVGVAFCAVLSLLLLFPGEGTLSARKIASVLEGAAALASLFSIDLLSTRLLSGALHSLFSRFSSTFMHTAGVEPGVRMLSIFGNANIFAGCIGIGVLLSLSLVLSAQNKRERRAHLCCLYINATAFLLAFSMGATASIAAAFVVFLLLEYKERRGDLFLLMIATFVLSLVSVAICSVTVLDAWNGIQPIPLLCLVAGCLLLCLTYEQINCRLARILDGKGTLLTVMTAAILVLLIGFALTAYNVTGPITLAQGETLKRSAYPAPGAYTLSCTGGEDVQITIYSQNKYETMMHTNTQLYSGPLQDAQFTVPEDSLVVHFHLQAQQPSHLEQVLFSGEADSGKIPLNYPLLPDFIANRLQGLFANQNAIQRTVFFEDGMKIFKMRPVFGFGIGAFMSVVQSVQDFLYETRYVHNHYIQTLLETGLVGLLLFVSLLVLSAVCVWKVRKKEPDHPLIPALGSCLIFMAIHGGVEMVFSVYCYLPLAFGVFILINLCCGHALPQPGKSARTILCLLLAVLTLVFSFFLSRNMAARYMTDRSKTYSTYDRAATIDPFEWKDYAINYMLSSTASDADEEIRQRGAYYAQRLDCGYSNIVYLHLTRYYLTLGQTEQAMNMAKIHAGYIAANSEEWCDLMHLLSQYAQRDPVFLQGVAQLAEMLDTWNQEHIGHVQLDEQAQAFVAWVLAQ